MMWLTIATVLTLTLCVSGAPSADEVKAVPGLKKQPPWRHYSGYLKATGTKHLHYWFIESAGNPETDPLVLWMNGGPGCSSVLGLLTEHGPFRIAKDGSEITYNPYSWNMKANMLYLEAPAGVGYSYADDKNYTTDDDQVANDNYFALKDFFSKFPEYKKNDFYVTGESYGGIYVPTLSARVLPDASINFKGMAIGNGIANFDMNDNSIMYFAYYHGLIGDSLWNKTLDTCCPEGSERCPFVQKYADNDACSDLVGQDLQKVYGIGLNEYNLYGPCLVPKPDGYIFKNNTFIYNTPSYVHRNHPYMKEKLNILKLKRQYFKSVRSTPPCIDADKEISYMNAPQVRDALHIPDGVQNWDVCSDPVSMHYKVIYHDVSTQYKQVLKAGGKILVYNGDIDMACNFLGDEWFVEALKQPLVSDRQPWYYEDTMGMRQVGGFVKKFEQITLTTIRGAGHMVPTDQPIPALKMFNEFISQSQSKRKTMSDLKSSNHISVNIN